MPGCPGSWSPGGRPSTRDTRILTAPAFAVDGHGAVLMRRGGPHVSGEPAVPVPTGLVAAQNARIWMADVLIGIEPTPAPIGGSVRFASSEARSRSVTLRRGC